MKHKRIEMFFDIIRDLSQDVVFNLSNAGIVSMKYKGIEEELISLVEGNDAIVESVETKISAA
tara:strand:- start:509 stop:697 length:189 start_codon:yes stop_codon:yes gene_type:complete